MFRAEGTPNARAENRSTPGMFREEQGGWRSRCRLNRGEVGGDKVREVTRTRLCRSWTGCWFYSEGERSHSKAWSRAVTWSVLPVRRIMLLLH